MKRQDRDKNLEKLQVQQEEKNQKYEEAVKRQRAARAVRRSKERRQ